MPLGVNFGGVWKDVPRTGMFVKHAGVWKNPVQGYAMRAGVWQPLWSLGPSVIFRGARTSNNAAQDWSFTNWDIGTEPNTLVVICQSTRNANESGSSDKMNVGGVALTRLTNNYQNPAQMQLGYGVVSPTGPVTIAVGTGGQFSGYGMFVACWTMTGYNSAVPVTSLNTKGSQGTRTLTMAYPDDAAIGILAGASGGTSAQAMAGTGVTQDGQANTGVGSGYDHKSTAGHLDSPGAGSYSATLTASMVLNGVVFR